MRRYLAIALVTAFVATPSSAQLPAGWKWYSNKYGAYSVCYPPQLHPDADSAGRVGRVFLAQDGTAMSVTAELDSFKTSDSSMKIFARRRGEEIDIANEGGRIIRKSSGKDWIVSIGRRPQSFLESPGPRDFYRKIILVDGKYARLILEAPSAQGSHWRAAAMKILDCFHGS